MRLIIAGGRDYNPQPWDLLTIQTIVLRLGVDEIVSGGATGADAIGEAYAKENGIDCRIFPAKWREYGKQAGPLRNRRMAEYADALLYFPGGEGTAGMIEAAKARGLQIIAAHPEVDQ